MTYNEIHPSLRAAIGVFESLRKLGFLADDIYIELANNSACSPSELMVFILLRAQDKEFRVGVGMWPRDALSDERLELQWRALCAAMHDREVPQEDMDRIWQESAIYRDKAGFVAAILNKGITIPNVSAPPMPQEFSVPCEFCSGTVTSMQDPEEERGIAIAHSTPTCKKFDKLDALSFLKSLNASIAKRKATEKKSAPTSPSPGDVCLGCIHRPDPEVGCHYFWLGGNMPFRRTDDTMGYAKWLLLCSSCFVEHADKISENLRAGKVKVGCDLVWPDGLDVEMVKH